MAYAGTMQESCLRLMGQKLLVSLVPFAKHWSSLVAKERDPVQGGY